MKFLNLWLPPVAWSGLIFLGSAIPALPVSENGVVDFLTHKIVHLFEYAVFFLFLYRALVGGRRVWERMKIITALLVSAAFGLSDEFHQVFTPGREARVRDVIVDFGGALLGLLWWKYLVGVKKKLLV